MTGHYLQLSIELDQWTGVLRGFYRLNTRLQVLWEETRNPLFPGNNYLNAGIDALVAQIKSNPFFFQSQAVKNLNRASFTAPNGMETVRDLRSFLENNARVSPYADAFVLGMSNWLDSKIIEFAAGTNLSGLWNQKFNNNVLPYTEFGIPKLVTTFRDDEEFFEHCGTAQALQNSTIPGRGINTVGDFHGFLLPCA
ncbi:MAG TPA: hypothetical protein VF648_13960 [Pyrinomonadaceae bacterium]|jgi:hypothetical protein